jgi:hypothetical protein
VSAANAAFTTAFCVCFLNALPLNAMRRESCLNDLLTAMTYLLLAFCHETGYTHYPSNVYGGTILPLVPLKNQTWWHSPAWPARG